MNKHFETRTKTSGCVWRHYQLQIECQHIPLVPHQPQHTLSMRTLQMSVSWSARWASTLPWYPETPPRSQSPSRRLHQSKTIDQGWEIVWEMQMMSWATWTPRLRQIHADRRWWFACLWRSQDISDWYKFMHTIIWSYTHTKQIHTHAHYTHPRHKI